MRTWFATGVACIALGLVLAACGSSAHPASSLTGQPPGGSGRSETEAIVQCYRAHGDPGFPDPVYDPSDGRWHFAQSPASAPLSTQQACQHLFPSTSPSPPVSQAQYQADIRFAECMRAHGVPNWPDPNPQGEFPLPPQLMQKTSAGRSARNACDRYLPSGGLDVIAAP